MHQTLNRILWGCGLILFVWFLAAPFLSFDFVRILNSDEVYIPILWKDLFVDRNSFSGWHIPPYTNLTITFPVYSVIRFFSGEEGLAFSLFLFIQNIVFAFGVFAFISNRLARVQSFFLTFIISSFFIYLDYSGAVNFKLVTIAYHGNTIVVSLLLLALIRNILMFRRCVWPVYIALSAGNVLLILNDNLAIAAFALPSLCGCVAVLTLFPSKKHLLLTIHLTVSLILGYIVSKHLFVEGRQSLGLNLVTFAEQSQQFSSLLITQFRGSWVGLLCLAMIFGGLFCAVNIFYSKIYDFLRKIKKSDQKNDLSQIVSFFFATFTFSLFVSNLIAIPITGLFVDLESFRYIGLPLVIPILFLFQQMNQFYWGTFINVVLIVGWGLGSVFLTVPYQSKINKNSGIHNADASICRLMDRIVEETGVSDQPIAGLADFWKVGMNRFIPSKHGVQLIQISDLGYYRRWMNNIDWFLEEIPPIRFIITNGIKTDHLISRYGEPERIIYEGRYCVWLYSVGYLNPYIEDDIKKMSEMLKADD